MSFKNIVAVKEFLGKNYPSIKPIIEIKLLKHNNINSINYFVKTTKNTFVLRNLKDSSSIKKIDEICKILEYCKNNKIKTIEPIKNKQKIFINKPYKSYLTKYYEGDIFHGNKLEIKDLAITLAKLHNRLEKYPFKFNHRTNNQFYKILTLDEYDKIIVGIRNNEKEPIDRIVNKNYNLIKNTIILNDKYAKEITKNSRKKQIIHNDLHPDNILFLKNQVNVILDFHSIKNDTILRDVSMAGFRFSAFKQSSYEKIQNNMDMFLENYCKSKQIENIEIEIIFQFVVNEFLRKISYILKKRYFTNSNAWNDALGKNLEFLKLILKIQNNVNK